ncbi:hypothetical protein NZK33_01065 [Cyanobium sp. FGCU-6]|nr:hypothetical protein [Cyanobium sp. FGCU6]
MGWDPAVLRKYSTTGHFRLLNQVRSELRGNPLIRPRDGETVGAANRSRSLIRALEVRASAGAGARSRRAAPSVVVTTTASLAAATPAPTPSLPPLPHAAPADVSSGSGPDNGFDSAANSFRDRLNAIDMR